MKIDYIRRDINEEISEEGGAFVQIVNKDTVGLKDSIKEAKDSLYCVGDTSMIEGYFAAIMRSVFEGIRSDGHPRTVGDVTFYPTCGGLFDLDTGWNAAVNDVRVRARLINGVELDISDWTFNDVTEGRVAFSLKSVSDGTTNGVVSSDSAANVNGSGLPEKSNLTVSWECNSKSGTVASDKFTSNVSRITILAAAFATLGSADSGKEIVITVKGCYNKATIKGVFLYVAPVVAPTFTDVTQDGHDADELAFGESEYVVNGASLKESGDTYRLDLTEPGGGVCLLAADFNEAGSTAAQLKFTKLTNNSGVETASWVGKTAKFTIVRGGVEYTHNVTIVAS